jgi:DNA-binding HxlR family transcriptional regulator
MQPTILGCDEAQELLRHALLDPQCLEIVGDRWSLLIVRDVFLGVTRFDDFQQRLGISRNILNWRLAHLVEQGILTKASYTEHPPRFDYKLTPKGRDLWPIVTAMRQRGDSHAAPDGPPSQLIHHDCGQISDGHMTCSVCGGPVDASNVKAIPGPGAVEPLIGSAWRAAARSTPVA